MRDVILADDLDDTPWSLIDNNTDDLETSQSGHPHDPDTWSIGYSGESIFAKQLSSLTDEPVQVIMQVNWTAIDPTLRYRRTTYEFTPEVEVLGTALLEPTETIYLVDHPRERVDADYTLQGVFQEEKHVWAEEAIDDADALLYQDI